MEGKLVTLCALVPALSVVCMAGEVGAVAPPGVAAPVATAPALPERPEVARYALRVLAGEARANAAVLLSGERGARRQAHLLEALLQVRNEVSVDGLPAGFKEYALGLREIRNDLTPRIVEAFMSVDSGELEEEGLTDAIAPLESEMYGRMEALDAAYPEAARVLGDASMTGLMLELARGVQADGAGAGQAGFYLRLAEKIEGMLEGI